MATASRRAIGDRFKVLCLYSPMTQPASKTCVTKLETWGLISPGIHHTHGYLFTTLTMRLSYNRYLPLSWFTAPMLCLALMDGIGSTSTLSAQAVARVAINSEQKLEKSASVWIAQAASETEKQQLINAAEQLSQQVTQLYNQGRFSEAVPLAQQALSIAEKALGSEHLTVANNLNELALLYDSQGLYAQAEPLYQRALSIVEKALGAEHPNVAAGLNNLAVLYDSQGFYAKAEPLHQRALSIVEKALGAEHPNVATSLNNLAELYRAQGLYAQAEPLYQRALNIREKALGAEHPNVAASLNNLAVLYDSQSLYAQAEPLHQKALSIWEKTLGAEHPNVATSLNNLAELYRAQGLYAQAEPLYQRALNIREKTLGAKHPDVATSLNNLALLYDAQSLYAKAKPLYHQALSIWEKTLGAEHPTVANSLNNLAALYDSQGLYGKAEPLYQRALSIWEKTLGAEHPTVAASLNNLALLYEAQGLYAKAEPLYQQALNICEKTLGPEHPTVATSLNNLAALYNAQGLYGEAESLYQRALSIWEKALGRKHPDVAASLNNLAGLYRAQGFYAKAEPLYQRALSIAEKALGTEHSTVAASLNGLAALYYAQGLYSKAEPLYQQALSIREKTLGANHPTVATSLTNLAVMYNAQGNLTQTHELLNQTAEIEERNLDLILSTGSESRRSAYIATLSGTTDVAISFHLNDAPGSLPSAQLALSTILRRKGRVLSSLTDSLQSLQQNLAPADRALLEQLTAIRSQRATLTFQGPGQLTREQHQTTLAQLKTQEDDLENQLARKSAEFRAEVQPITLANVQKQIPKNAALVELVKYYPFNAKAIKKEPQWAEPHYAAYILKANGELQWVNLGKAELIDQSVAQFRQALQSSTSNIKPIARKLDQQLMQPIRVKLGGTRQLLLSPDSQLNLIPFAALVDEKNQYLVENYDMTYLSSGRDLLKLQSTTASHKRQAPVIMADPDYQNQGVTASATAQTEKNRSSRDLNLIFSPLPGTQAEASQLQKLLPKATLLTQTQATEQALKQVNSPEILHIATHGFFLETDLEAVPSGTDRAGIDVIYKPGHSQQPRQSYENPLLRSGLALAGANARKSGGEDGIFTALEAAGLNLRGTQLVVLSACETGLGDVTNGEGVYGLRRAFVMAGSASQVLSLWKVDDQGTKDWMVAYYQQLLQREGRGQALRQTQLQMLGSNSYGHPYYWAAFIPSGDWRPL
jgi:CHAT domain-containing protein